MCAGIHVFVSMYAFILPFICSCIHAYRGVRDQTIAQPYQKPHMHTRNRAGVTKDQATGAMNLQRILANKVAGVGVGAKRVAGGGGMVANQDSMFPSSAEEHMVVEGGDTEMGGQLEEGECKRRRTDQKEVMLACESRACVDA